MSKKIPSYVGRAPPIPIPKLMYLTSRLALGKIRNMVGAIVARTMGRTIGFPIIVRGLVILI